MDFDSRTSSESGASRKWPSGDGRGLLNFGMWRQFIRDTPGRRFRNLHERRQRNRQGAYTIETFLKLFGGAAVAVLGLILMLAPGPGTLVFAIGMAILATELGFVARFMDRAEVRVRDLFRELKLWWLQRTGSQAVTIEKR